MYGKDKSGAGGSYMETFEKNKTKKRVLTYKPYTLHDYRKMQKEVRLGGLGPDLQSDTVKEKVNIHVVIVVTELTIWQNFKFRR